MSYEDIRGKRLPYGLTTRLYTDDLIGEILTVESIRMMKTREGSCALLTFREYPECFYFGGVVFMSMYQEFENDPEAYYQLRNGEVRIVIYWRVSNATGYSYATFDYVD